VKRPEVDRVDGTIDELAMMGQEGDQEVASVGSGSMHIEQAKKRRA
jgi:hypothetical protein